MHGCTISNNKLYVVTCQSPDIDVNDIDMLAHRQKITVEGLVDENNIVVQANWLHVSERRDKLIHRIHFPDETASYWSVNSRYLTMSLKKRGNIVVSCYDLHKIFKHTPIGTCVREIQVNRVVRAIIGMQHAIQLDEDRFLIRHS